MNEKEKYESMYEDKIYELFVLLKKDSGIAYETEHFRVAYTYLYAYLDPKNQSIVEKETRLEWLVPKSFPEENKLFAFRKDICYKIRARRRKPGNDANITDEWFEVLDILESDVKNYKMMEILEEMKKPVVVNDKSGIFTLNRDMNWFEGEIDWLGTQCSVSLFPDEDKNMSIESGLHSLNKIIDNIKEYDSRVRAFAADKLIDGANEYAADDDKPLVTQEEFCKRMKISSIVMDNDGSASIYFEDDDMFWGHTIVVYIDEDGEMSEADIAG